MSVEGMVLVYSTFPDKESAEAVGSELVAAKLAACVNIFPGMTAVYAWQGQVKRGEEAAMLAKTTRAGRDRLMAELKARHPYEVPAIIAVDAARVDAAYLSWLTGEVAPV